MTGTITRRGKRSWRLKYDLPRDETGERRVAYATVKGTRRDAERELRAKLTAMRPAVPSGRAAPAAPESTSAAAEVTTATESGG